MSTWHQDRRKPFHLWHQSKWTVVTDPPHDCMSVMRFERKIDAEVFLKVAGPHSYIVSPTREGL